MFVWRGFLRDATVVLNPKCPPKSNQSKKILSSNLPGARCGVCVECVCSPFALQAVRLPGGKLMTLNFSPCVTSAMSHCVPRLMAAGIIGSTLASPLRDKWFFPVTAPCGQETVVFSVPLLEDTFCMSGAHMTFFLLIRSHGKWKSNFSGNHAWLSAMFMSLYFLLTPYFKDLPLNSHVIFWNDLH